MAEAEDTVLERRIEHRLVKPGRYGWSGARLERKKDVGELVDAAEEQEVSTVSLNRADRVSTVSLNQDDGAEDMVLERSIEHRLIKPGRYGRSRGYGWVEDGRGP
ncbi:hypothetical protein BDD12DRAFT_884926 [Trichophaea hybrida]|nr:hypothetical protein BDD12DRAFT_884926 [Trichophaea hybrida]